MSADSITVAALLDEGALPDGAELVKTEDGQMQIHVYETEGDADVDEEADHRDRYYAEAEGGGEEEEEEDGEAVFVEAGLEEDNSQSMPDLEQLGEQQQDLVSLALEGVVGDHNGEGHDQEQQGGGGGTAEDFPDEIECQLIQKNVLINGQIQTIDFIMCNQCPRLFRTENLLWNHIKAKHKRRGYRRSVPPTGLGMARKPGDPEGSPLLEPGEIHPSSVARMEAQQAQHQGRSVGDNLYVVGLERQTGGEQEAPFPQVDSSAADKPEKYQRQRARKRIYVDSNHGPFKCPGCDAVTFTNRRSLDQHMRKIHKAGIVECDECGRKVLDLKRHKEILHKRFKIYSCPHCPDKYCTQEDLERHLMKVEANNAVNKAGGVLPTTPNTSTTNTHNVIPADMEEKEQEDKTEEIGEEEEKEKAQGLVKEMENKSYSCSECGLKTPSRMTYIQHVLNGCIMDMVMGEAPPVSKETSVQGKTEEIKLSDHHRRVGSLSSKKQKVALSGES